MTRDEIEEVSIEQLTDAYHMGQIPALFDSFDIDAWTSSESGRLEWAKHTTPQEILDRLLQFVKDTQTEVYIDELLRRLRNNERC